MVQNLWKCNQISQDAYQVLKQTINEHTNTVTVATFSLMSVARNELQHSQQHSCRLAVCLYITGPVYAWCDFERVHHTTCNQDTNLYDRTVCFIHGFLHTLNGPGLDCSHHKVNKSNNLFSRVSHANLQVWLTPSSLWISFSINGFIYGLTVWLAAKIST